MRNATKELNTWFHQIYTGDIKHFVQSWRLSGFLNLITHIILLPNYRLIH